MVAVVWLPCMMQQHWYLGEQVQHAVCHQQSKLDHKARFAPHTVVTIYVADDKQDSKATRCYPSTETSQFLLEYVLKWSWQHGGPGYQLPDHQQSIGYLGADCQPTMLKGSI